MRGALGVLGLVIVAAIGLSVYRTSVVGSGRSGTENPRATLDMVGVKTDLTAIGRAERDFMALNGRYATLELFFKALKQNLVHPGIEWVTG